jgi:hypothetical protein
VRQQKLTLTALRRRRGKKKKPQRQRKRKPRRRRCASTIYTSKLGSFILYTLFHAGSSYQNLSYDDVFFQDKRANKEVERQQKKEEIDANAGPSQRELELERINTALSKDKLKVKEVASDGHCLYRYVRALKYPGGAYSIS